MGTHITPQADGEVGKALYRLSQAAFHLDNYLYGATIAKVQAAEVSKLMADIDHAHQAYIDAALAARLDSSLR